MRDGRGREDCLSKGLCAGDCEGCRDSLCVGCQDGGAGGLRHAGRARQRVDERCGGSAYRCRRCDGSGDGLGERERDKDRIGRGNADETGGNGADRGEEGLGAGVEGANGADRACLAEGEGEGRCLWHNGGKRDYHRARCRAFQGKAHHGGRRRRGDRSHWRSRGGKGEDQGGGCGVGDHGDGENRSRKCVGDRVGGGGGGKGGDGCCRRGYYRHRQRVRLRKGNGEDGHGQGG